MQGVDGSTSLIRDEEKQVKNRAASVQQIRQRRHARMRPAANDQRFDRRTN
jgi:hypothetical protein